MKRYLAIAALSCLSCHVFAYQIEGNYWDINLGVVNGQIGSSSSGVVDNSPRATAPFMSIGFGNTKNLTNSISWQEGIAYFQTNPLLTRGSIEGIGGYSYNNQSSGLWYSNSFHFDVLTGSLTPIQPYATVLIGLARNYAYNFNTDNNSLYFNAKTNYQVAYGAELGVSYQINSWQVISAGVDHWELGQSQIGHIPGATGSLKGNAVSLTGFGLHYTIQL